MPDRKLRNKIAVGTAGIILLMGLSMLLLIQTVVYDALRTRLEKRGVSIARHVAQSSINPILTERYFDIEMMVKDISRDEEGVEYIFILNRNGRVLAHTFEGGFPVELGGIGAGDSDRAYTTTRLDTESGRILDIAVPLLSGSAGVVHLGLSERYVQNDINAIMRLIVFLMLIVLALGYVFSVLLSRRVVRPLLEIARVAEAVSKGDLDQKVEVRSNDEIGVLSASFNEMIQKRRQNEAEREAIILELQSAMKEIKTLHGLLPICAWCKKVRDDQGYWSSVETYVSSHTDAEFTHGICPECYKRVQEEEEKLG